LNSQPCTWCGDDVDPDDGFRAYDPAGGRRAVFCRLEHIIPWAIQGSQWGAGGVTEPAGTEKRLRAVRIASHSSARCTSCWCS
jgi:hypothetical protein